MPWASSARQQHPGVVGHLDDGPQVGADAVVGGVVDQHGHGVGMLLDGLCHLLPLHAQGDAQALVHLGVDVDRHRAAEHQRVQHAAVDVAGQDDLIAPLAGGEHHALHAAGGAAHHQKGVGRAKGVRRQLLGLPDDRHRVAEVVQRLHAVDVHAHTLLAQEGRQLGVAPPSLVAGHVKGDDPHLPEPLQRLVDGGAALVQLGPFGFVHSLSSVRGLLCSAKQKSASPAHNIQACASKKRSWRREQSSRPRGARQANYQKDLFAHEPKDGMTESI